MKTVLFCGGLGTRIRDYSENIPKPMIPIGDKPILWHLMQYYSQYGHRDFVLCLGYKANVIKEFFLNYRPHIYADCVVSGFGDNIETLGDPQRDWRITMIDTGVWRNIGERLLAVRAHVEGEEMFLANYSDGLSDVDLPAMIEAFQQERQGCLFRRRAPLLQPASRRDGDERQGQRPARHAGRRPLDQWRLLHLPLGNLRLSARGRGTGRSTLPRLIEADQLLAFKHEGFWRPMDTLKDKEVLEDMVEQGRMPWRLGQDGAVARAKSEPKGCLRQSSDGSKLQRRKSCACWSLGIWATSELSWCRCCSSRAMRLSASTAIFTRAAPLPRAARSPKCRISGKMCATRRQRPRRVRRRHSSGGLVQRPARQSQS